MDDLKNYNLDFPLSIVIGLYNKEKDIVNTINRIFHNIISPKVQLIIIDNESQDNSYNLVKALKKKLIRQNFELILLQSKKGLGIAIREGLKFVKCEYIYILPADLGAGFSELEYLTKNKIKYFEFLLGSKSHKDSKMNRRISRKLYSKLLNILQRSILKIKHNDTQGSMLFSKRIIENEQLISKNFLITTEIVLLAKIKNFQIIEVPLFEIEQFSKSTVKPIRDGTKMIFDLFILRKNYIS